jgi:hypothetical protein
MIFQHRKVFFTFDCGIFYNYLKNLDYYSNQIHRNTFLWNNRLTDARKNNMKPMKCAPCTRVVWIFRINNLFWPSDHSKPWYRLICITFAGKTIKNVNEKSDARALSSREDGEKTVYTSFFFLIFSVLFFTVSATVKSPSNQRCWYNHVVDDCSLRYRWTSGSADETVWQNVSIAVQRAATTVLSAGVATTPFLERFPYTFTRTGPVDEKNPHSHSGVIGHIDDRPWWNCREKK